jgi:hypothetical protein
MGKQQQQQEQCHRPPALNPQHSCHVPSNTVEIASLTPHPASYGVQERSRTGRAGPTWYAGEFRGGRRSGRGLGLWLSEDGFQEGLYEGEWLQVCDVHLYNNNTICLSRLFHNPLPFPASLGQAPRHWLPPIQQWHRRI